MVPWRGVILALALVMASARAEAASAQKPAPPPKAAVPQKPAPAPKPAPAQKPPPAQKPALAQKPAPAHKTAPAHHHVRARRAAHQPAPAPEQPVAPPPPPPPLPAPAPTGTAVIPCDGLPPNAVQAAPSPLDQYVTVVCTAQGQALRPVDGSQWVFGQQSEWLTATNPNRPSPNDRYTGLEYRPMQPDELAAMRGQLAALQPDPEVLERPILRFAVTTSWGAKKEIYILPPTDKAARDAHPIGMECLHHCLPIDHDPWFFAIVPTR